MNWARVAGAASRAATAAVLVAAWVAPNSTESAVANGDTRTVVFSNQHTNEEGSFTYMVNGVYDQSVLDKLNWFMRDWRLNEPTKMDPRLFDIIWEVYRESGSKEPVDVLSGYRSPHTNAMLRRRSRQVAAHSQHMEGRAIDAHFVDVSTARIRDIAMRMQEGGVGFYPTGMTPWVHIDCGSVRYWPRMSREALTRLFPDGKTVFIPADGKPMPGYELAKAEIESRGGQIQTASGGGLFAWLFGSRGGGEDDAEEAGGGEATMAVAGRSGGRGGGGAVQIADAGPAAIARAKANLPTGPAYASAPEPAPKSAPAPTPAAASKPEAAPPQPEVVAALEQPNVESDAEPDSLVKLHGPIAALYLAPLPPRRPSARDLLLASLGELPLPPSRPADLVAASNPEALAPGGRLPPARPAGLDAAPQTTASIGPMPPARPATFRAPAAPPSNGGAKALPAGAGADLEQLPKVITAGVSAPPTRALALAELPPTPQYDPDALLQRAAELTAPLPPMPIPSASAQPEAKPVPPPPAGAPGPQDYPGCGAPCRSAPSGRTPPRLIRACAGPSSSLRSRSPTERTVAFDAIGSLEAARTLNRATTANLEDCRTVALNMLRDPEEPPILPHVLPKRRIDQWPNPRA